MVPSLARSYFHVEVMVITFILNSNIIYIRIKGALLKQSYSSVHKMNIVEGRYIKEGGIISKNTCEIHPHQLT